MSLIFYKKYIPSEKEIWSMHELIDNHDWDTLNEKLKKISEPIHICTMSGGWQVHFDHHNGEYYTPSTCKAWINNVQTGIIIDETGNEYTPEHFWSIIEQHNAQGHNFAEETDSNYSNILEKEKNECLKKFKNIKFIGKSCYFMSEDGLTFPSFSNFE